MIIRKATLSDLEKIFEVESICFNKEEAATKESFEKRLTYYPDRFWLLEDNKKLIGFVNGMLTNQNELTDNLYEEAYLHDKNGSWQMIFGVNTLPAYRRQGLAEKILNEVIKEAKEEKRAGLVLTCKEHLVHYYEKFGFIDEGISESTHGGVVWHKMRLTF